MNDIFLKARNFILMHARLLERRIFEVHFEGVPSVFVDKIALFAACRLAEYTPDKNIALNILDVIATALPRAMFYIPNAPVKTYGLTPLHFAPKPDSFCRKLFTSSQIEGHLEELIKQQLPDGGWPIYWEAPGSASELEWRGRWTLDAICRLTSYRILQESGQ